MKPWPYPRLVAHRAGGALAPENTLAGIRFGQSLGYRVVEIDIRFTRDGIPVLQHDAAIDRNTNGKGPIADHAWADLARLDAGSWRGEEYRGEPLVRLADAAALLRELRMYAHVEVKRVPGRHRECGERVAREVRRCWEGAAEAPLLISFSADALAAAKLAEPALPRGWIVEDPWDGNLAPLAELDAVSLHLEHVLITPALVREVHAAGRRILAWTVNDLDRAEELLAAGVDGLVTDNLRQFATRFPELL
jgi:glycerophosphoryl diester phosphodiesterase